MFFAFSQVHSLQEPSVRADASKQTLRLLCLPLLLFLCAGAASADDAFSIKRNELIDTIEADVMATRDFLDKQVLSARVLEAMRKVPRHEFVPEDQREYAYENRPLPIGHGQTISQPYIVAIMTDLLMPKPTDRVLEVGTGSAYQAAVLAELVDSVYSIEIVEALGLEAAARLKQLGYDNVETRIGDGYYGWEEKAPFDAVIVTAASSHIPPPLIKQLKPGGRMIIPVGSRFMVQHLVLVTKDLEDKVTTRQILPVAFVPLTGTH
ncbi:MAG: protein-L-isoaspartate(D-aspartate) O-methyltransferase [Gammaproteobacteria bacterium]